MKVCFEVRCLPVAQPRQRTRVVFTGSKAHGQNYTPTKHPVNAFKATVLQAFQAAYKGPPLAGPLAVEVLFLFPRPKRMVWKKMAMPRAWHWSKPDADNVLKSFLDGLKGVAFVDDAQVCELAILKMYAAGGEAPGVSASIEQLVEVESPPQAEQERGLCQ